MGINARSVVKFNNENKLIMTEQTNETDRFRIKEKIQVIFINKIAV